MKSKSTEFQANTNMNNSPNWLPFSDQAKPSLDLISALGCVEFGDRKCACLWWVCKGGCCRVHIRLRHKYFIQDRKQRSLSPGESFIGHSESSSYSTRTELCPGVCWDFLENVVVLFNIKEDFEGSLTLVLSTFFVTVMECDITDKVELILLPYMSRL